MEINEKKQTKRRRKSKRNRSFCDHKGVKFMMNFEMGSRFAIIEKKHAKRRGLGSVFFQIFDWNKMLSKKKKKLFPNHKLLLPSVSKKFDGDEKMPQHKQQFLYTDGKIQSTPNSYMHNEKNNQMREAGPVAKLMGLESMPIVHDKKPKKPSPVSEFSSNRLVYPENKETRPQKLQKTEGQPSLNSPSNIITSNKRSRRQNHHKLASPIKSPRLVAKRNNSRLTDAASKILEHGHSRKSAKCALNYGGLTHFNDNGVGPSGSFRSLGKNEKLSLNSEIKYEAPVVAKRSNGINMQLEDDRRKSRPSQAKLVNDSKTYNRQSSKGNNNGLNGAHVVKILHKETLEGSKYKASKRRPHDDLNDENGKSTSFRLEKQRSASDSITQKGKKAVHNISPNSRLDSSEAKVNDVASFKFNSPMKCADKRANCKPKHLKNSTLNEKSYDMVSQKESILRGDELSAILQKKMEELTSYSNTDDIVAYGNDHRGKSDELIFGELVSLFRPVDEETICSESTNISECTVPNSEIVKADGKFQPAYASSEGEHPSPMSILEVSFSNDSCFSGSPLGSSGHKQDNLSTGVCNKIASLELDTDLQDSASSIDIKKLDTAEDPGDNTRSFAIQATDLSGIWFSESTLSPDAKSNAKLLLEVIPLPHANEKDFFVNDILQATIKASGKFDTRLILDCIIEYFDCRFYCLFKPRCKFSLLTKQESLWRLVCEEINVWKDMVGESMHDIVEKDMRHPYKMWWEFEVETLESIVQIENGIVSDLVNELVIDLCY